MATYVVHPGTGVLPDGTTAYIDAGTLAGLYGLDPMDYEVGTTEQDEATHIHLHPRSDGKYRNIKILLGDNGTPYHIDKMVNYRKHRREQEDDSNHYLYGR